MTHDKDVQGRPWARCGACPHPTPGACPSRRHRFLCRHLADRPEKWGPRIAAMAAETREARERHVLPARIRRSPSADDAAPTTSQPCRHLGEQVGYRDCPSCQGTVRIKVFSCSHPAHGTTTLKSCASCPDYASKLG